MMHSSCQKVCSNDCQKISTSSFLCIYLVRYFFITSMSSQVHFDSTPFSFCPILQNDWYFGSKPCYL
uniref:Ovule protein n=1 Tax=Caenorhabditis tropicalis TaxID=1561998 RepID=A0A1I7T4F7_9PELO